MKRCIYYIAISLSCFACRHTADPANAGVAIDINDDFLKQSNGMWTFNEGPFTGRITQKYAGSRLKSLQTVVNGKLNGPVETYYPDGTLETSRWYTNGEKDSIHYGWWPNGNKRFEYHYDLGVYNGLFEEWYEDGHLLQQIFYTHGQQTQGTGWRDNGDISMNFIVKDGRYYGLIGTSLCSSVDSEQVK